MARSFGQPDLFTRRIRRPPAPLEIALHGQVADLLRTCAHRDWRWTHMPSGEERDPRVGAKLQRMGLAKGWPDLILLPPEASRGACFLELKRRGGKPTEEQLAFGNWCVASGYRFGLVDSIKDATAVLASWGALRTKIEVW